MSQYIEISNDAYEKASALGAGLFTPAEVVEKLIADHQPDTHEVRSIGGSGLNPARGLRIPRQETIGRTPRQRGVRFSLEGSEYSALSVKDMYEKVIRWVVDEGHINKLKEYVPHSTSQSRYLVARSPLHPSGSDFVIPVEYRGYYLEAHKDYKNAISHVRQWLAKADIQFLYLG